MKILVVDDELDICEILQYNLETEGFEVATACSAEEALELPLQDYGLILLDVMMGEMSGFQMARRLKGNAATAHIPIIFITALDGEDNLVKGLNIGQATEHEGGEGQGEGGAQKDGSVAAGSALRQR